MLCCFLPTASGDEKVSAKTLATFLGVSRRKIRMATADACIMEALELETEYASHSASVHCCSLMDVEHDEQFSVQTQKTTSQCESSIG